ncbi:7-cyano-7-deazaguanine synthase QueC [Polynucleobacter sp.]|uniref:7-cyano-7-deazaguanine synthase QueC n=1 Tax=Polynucleobacter sp. TaxID=2029855 RepID=UPI003F695283
MTKTIAIVSGGMDSVTLLHLLKHKGHEVEALSFDYGQKHRKELDFAWLNCGKLGVKHQIVDLTAITPLISNSALTGSEEVPDGHYTDESMKVTVVPNRNMIMLAVAIGYAENLGFDQVAIGNHAGDHAIYPDCRTEFVEALSEASQLGTYNKIKLATPFTDISKSDIAAVGNEIGVDYRTTWSCYKGGDKHCNTCGTCVERLEALDEAKQIDGKSVIARLTV